MTESKKVLDEVTTQITTIIKRGQLQAEDEDALTQCQQMLLELIVKM